MAEQRPGEMTTTVGICPKAASMAIEVHGAETGHSNDYPVERYLRNCKAAIIYEGTRDIHTLMQTDGLWV